MKNAITVTIPFHFRGEAFQPSARIDLNELANAENAQTWLVQRIAAENGIDLYAYEYEVMEATMPVFSDPEGLATAYLTDGQLDLAGFRQEFAEQAIMDKLIAIAREKLGIEDLTLEPAISKALRAAFEAGRTDGE